MNLRSVDERWMRLALSLGARGLGRVWPNPAVGCVIVKDGVIAGRGWTQPGGQPHGETMALAQAGQGAAGATAYVTLEPCAHHGKTPPCAQALIQAGVARVVYATADPDPRVASKGDAMLQVAGVSVTTGVLENQAQRANAGFLSRVTKGCPIVTLKLASSLDGRIATRTGESQWITGPQARAEVHLMRAVHDAVMVGAGTAVADDPSLTVRSPGLEDHQPIRVVLDSNLRVSHTSNLGRTAREIPVWMLHCHGVARKRLADWAKTGAVLIPCKRNPEGAVDIADALAQLGSMGLTRVFCEGGGELAASLLRADLVEDLVSFTAGLAIGADGRPGLGALGVSALNDAKRFSLQETRQVGADLMCHWARC